MPTAGAYRSNGVITQGYGRVLVEVIDAPSGVVPACVRRDKCRWRCRDEACQMATFLEDYELSNAPRAHLRTRPLHWAIRQLRFEGATLAGMDQQLATTRNTVYSHIKSRLQAHLTISPVSLEPADIHPPLNVHHRLLGRIQAHGDGTRARHHDPLRAGLARARHGLREDVRPPAGGKPLDYELPDALILHQLHDKQDFSPF